MVEFEWKNIPGATGCYSVSTDGQVKHGDRLLKPTITPKGYLIVKVPTLESKYNKFVN